MKAASELIGGLAFLVLGLGAVYLSRDFAADAAAFPAVIGVLMALLSCAMIVRTLAASVTYTQAPAPLVKHWPRFVASIAITLAYIVILPTVGFFSSSALFVPVLSVVLGFRRPAYLAITTVLFIALLYALFTLLLRRPLPPEFFLPF